MGFKAAHENEAGPKRGWADQVGPWLLAAALFVSGCSSSDPPDPHGEARALEARILAPCCWVQTLDSHESELAAELRAEIERRIAGGEAAEAILDDFAARYGERVRAGANGDEIRGAIPGLVGAGMILSLLALFALARRWTRRRREPPPVSAASSDEYDAKLADELALLEDP